MAVVGYLQDVMKNQVFPELITRGLMYLATLADEAFNDLAPGDSRRVELQDDALFALNQIYETKALDQAKFEAHQRYIDIQYVFQGRETLQLASLNDAAPITAYDAEKDFTLYRVEDYSPISLKPGMVCILFPEDLHAPCLDCHDRGLVKKTVIKVRLQP